MLYNLACFHSVAGRVNEALELMKKALDLGFLHREWYLTDSDLENVRRDPRFEQLMAAKFRES
jgi:adenylate cyclase